ncbi:unnamed protein product, partial [Mesorhabditis belari]|uniref:Guanylate cyclase domain-containing protein n=1 Tax=Mesorhabditis belari TaxID=2138241 RepID=A0AAF3J7B1_9BILA
MRSLRSSKSSVSGTGSKFSFGSKHNDSGPIEYFLLMGDPLMAMKHKVVSRLTIKDHHELRLIRRMEHDNVHRFIGLCEEASPVLTIWRLASRGSLEQVLTGSSMNIDGFFMYSLIRDLVEGMCYINKSFLKGHRRLSSQVCYIDDRWQLKGSDRKQNLMDHVFNILENYAETLEKEVQDRTGELVEKKKKNVVKFTNLAAKCTPLQIVNLLNDLYSTFDQIIEEHGVYKGKGVMSTYWLLGRVDEPILPSMSQNRNEEPLVQPRGVEESRFDPMIEDLGGEQVEDLGIYRSHLKKLPINQPDEIQPA